VPLRNEERRRHDDQAHRLVENDRLERWKAEWPDEKRQPELGAAKTYEPAKRPDEAAGGKGANGSAGRSRVSVSHGVTSPEQAALRRLCCCPPPNS